MLMSLRIDLHNPGYRFFFVDKRDAENGAICPKQIIFQEKLNICYLTESLLIENIWSSSKVIDFIWMLFCFLWKCCLLNANAKCYASYQYCYTNACLAMVQKHILKIWDDSVVNKRLSLCLNIFISFNLRFSWIGNDALW